MSPDLMIGLLLLVVTFFLALAILTLPKIVTRLRSQNPKIVNGIAVGVFIAVFVAVNLIPGATAHASVTLNFNLDPFFESLNQYLPIFIGLFAVIGGIAGAMALSNFVIGKVVDAFTGRI